MTPELEQLETRLKTVFGCWTRYQNNVFENHGTTATTEQKIELAKKVLQAGNLGVAAHQFEANRRDRLGRPKD